MAKKVRRKRPSQSPGHGRTGFVTRRTAIVIGATCVGLALAASLLLTYGPRAYDTWRESRLLKQATTMVRKQDFDGAANTAQEMLKLRSDSLAAFHILAEATEKQNRVETVAWRSEIARSLPHNLDAQLNLASAALRFGQLDTARRALDNVAPPDREKAAYHVVAGWLARAQGNEKDVEEHFAAALKQEPGNDLYQFNLAVLRIRSIEPEPYDEARATLERLSRVPGFRAGSLRALLNDAVERDDLPRADTLAQDLQMTQQVTFADYLLCLDFYRKLDEKKFLAVLEKIKPVAARNERDLGALMDWMIRNGRAGEVLKWSEKLPPALTAAPPPAVAIAEALAEVKNWSRLKKWTQAQGWGDEEYLRHAYQAHASRQAKQSTADADFESLWRAAERGASENPDRELTLARLAMRWDLPVEAEPLWQRVAKHAPMRREALDALARIYRVRDDLRNLLEVAKQLHESSPREPALTANYARLAFILEPNTEEAQLKAKEAYEAAPTEVNCAVTYAFALYKLGRTAEGLEILLKLPREQMLDPHSAVYAVALLVADNQFEAAQEFIAAAKEGPLYPEERNLFEEAMSKVTAPAPPSPPSTEPQALEPAPSPSPTPTPTVP